MSFQAMAWALALDMPKSTEKFVMVCLANYADESGRCYPSIDRLSRDTGQDRKTVIKALKSICAQGLAEDTGIRVGPTKSVIVYQIVGLPDISKFHYVYKLTDPKTGNYYYGKRSCDCDPMADAYRGSGKWPRLCASNGTFLEREVVAEFYTSAEALAYEASILRSIGDDPKCMNLERPFEMRRAYFKKLEQENTASSAKNGPAKQYQISHQAVPNFPPSSTKNGTQNLSSEPINEPIPPKVPQGDDAFERFWQAYPKRDGANPRKPAEQKFRIATRRVDPETIISAARAYADDQRKRHGGKRSPYTKQASVWLNQECWTEYGLQQSNEVDWPGWVEAYRTDRVWKDILGPRPDQGGCRAPVEVLRENGFAG